jgi:oligopeptide/dipeptide ABC transporter ATP-binding protein
MEYLSDRIAVIYLGRVMEIGPSRRVVASPRHPYTEALISAVPDAGGSRKRIILQGDAPSPVAPPSGCVFRTRCRYALPACADAVPTLREVAPGHWKACLRDDVPMGGDLWRAARIMPTSKCSTAGRRRRLRGGPTEIRRWLVGLG